MSANRLNYDLNALSMGVTQLRTNENHSLTSGPPVDINHNIRGAYLSWAGNFADIFLEYADKISTRKISNFGGIPNDTLKRGYGYYQNVNIYFGNWGLRRPTCRPADPPPRPSGRGIVAVSRRPPPCRGGASSSQRSRMTGAGPPPPAPQAEEHVIGPAPRPRATPPPPALPPPPTHPTTHSLGKQENGKRVSEEKRTRATSSAK